MSEPSMGIGVRPTTRSAGASSRSGHHHALMWKCHPRSWTVSTYDILSSEMGPLPRVCPAEAPFWQRSCDLIGGTSDKASRPDFEQLAVWVCHAGPAVGRCEPSTVPGSGINRRPKGAQAQARPHEN